MFIVNTVGGVGKRTMGLTNDLGDMCAGTSVSLHNCGREQDPSLSVNAIEARVL